MRRRRSIVAKPYGRRTPPCVGGCNRNTGESARRRGRRRAARRGGRGGGAYGAGGRPGGGAGQVVAWVRGLLGFRVGCRGVVVNRRATPPPPPRPRFSSCY